MAQAEAFETDFWKDANLRKAWDDIVPGEPLPELHPATRSATATTIPSCLTGSLPPAAYVDRTTPIVVRPC